MSETINFREHLKRHTFLAHLVLENSDKEFMAKMANQENYDPEKLNFEIKINGFAISSGDLIEFIGRLCTRKLTDMCEKVGYNEFKANVDVRQAQIEAAAKIASDAILGAEVRKPIIENLSGSIEKRIGELLQSLDFLHCQSSYLGEIMYAETQNKQVLRDIKQKLEDGSLDEEAQAHLLEQLRQLQL